MSRTPLQASPPSLSIPTDLLPHPSDLIGDRLPGPLHGMHSDAVRGRRGPRLAPGHVDRVGVDEQGHDVLARRLCARMGVKIVDLDMGCLFDDSNPKSLPHHEPVQLVLKRPRTCKVLHHQPCHTSSLAFRRLTASTVWRNGSMPTRPPSGRFSASQSSS